MLNIDVKASELIALLIVFIYAFFPAIPDIFRALKKKIKIRLISSGAFSERQHLITLFAVVPFT
jgi:hypothetical protein